ncbi:MAG: LacI family DNA-binding transcriptional regulator [Candidatus Omnitrophica bacterium]|nr:LacI family DNA-binding transcriptional regulator [Candidatus Omnitrophota bacterium]
MSAGKTRIAEVARAAKVSTTTVSRVLNNVPTVDEANRRRVLAAIKRLRYRPNANAQRLAAGRNNTMALVIPRFADMFRSFHVMEMLKGVGTAADRLHVDLLLHVTDGRGFPNVGAAAGILFADIDGNEEQLDWALQQGIPSIVMYQFLEDLPVSCVAVDNRAAVENVVAYLVKLGHREIATITGHLRTSIGIERLDGYLKAMQARQLEVKPHYVQHGDYTGASARPLAKRLLAHEDRPTAVVAASDEMAVAVIDTAMEMGLRVPEDLSVVGFDDSPIAKFSKVPLTTVWQPMSDVAERSVEILRGRLSGSSRRPVKERLGTRLVERQSCRQTWLDPS